MQDLSCSLHFHFIPRWKSCVMHSTYNPKSVINTNYISLHECMITVSHRVTEHIKLKLKAYQMLQGDHLEDLLWHSLLGAKAGCRHTGYRASLPINLVTDTEFNMLLSFKNGTRRPPITKHQDNKYRRKRKPLLIHVFKNEQQQLICLMSASQTNLSLDGKHLFLFQQILPPCSGMRW